MNRRETVFIKKPAPEPTAFEPVNPPHWTELLGMVLMTAIFAVAIALNVPEPVECGVDRDAATLDAGCKP